MVATPTSAHPARIESQLRSGVGTSNFASLPAKFPHLAKNPHYTHQLKLRNSCNLLRSSDYALADNRRSRVPDVRRYSHRGQLRWHCARSTQTSRILVHSNSRRTVRMHRLSFSTESQTPCFYPSVNRPRLRANDVRFACWIYSARMAEVFKERLTMMLGWRNFPITLIIRFQTNVSMRSGLKAVEI